MENVKFIMNNDTDLIRLLVVNGLTIKIEPISTNQVLITVLSNGTEDDNPNEVAIIIATNHYKQLLVKSDYTIGIHYLVK